MGLSDILQACIEERDRWLNEELEENDKLLQTIQQEAQTIQQKSQAIQQRNEVIRNELAKKEESKKDSKSKSR